MFKRIALHWQILGGMVLGVAIGFAAVSFDAKQLVLDWVKPFGTIFINLLKLIAVPLIIASLIKGVSDMKDISRLSKMGFRTLGLYILTTAFAVTLGLLVVNTIQPGKAFSETTRAQLMEGFAANASTKIADAEAAKHKGPLQPLVDMVPDNIFRAASENSNMLQVIFFVLLFGVGLILIPEEKAKPVKDFFLLGLGLLIFVFYPTLVRVFTGKSFGFFMKGIAPAQLVAFSTSSSAATLPVTMERVEEHLGVDEEVGSFVLPIGATINMDGTALYQAVAAVFIAEAMGITLTFGNQLSIVLTATLASIGSAAVPGAGMVMLVIVLGAIGVPEAGLALIFAVDRPLDMCRTVANVTSDATVSMIVAKSVGLLGEPHERTLQDDYPKK
ncbi:MAG: dicarboxylate/amino acid:cation symporter [Lewinellaceae bacterium]|nr:dicarboxylate/amino acid:cation symporter [Lewinellaceae bacterium]